MKTALRQRVVLVAAWFACTAATGQTDWAQINRQVDAQSRRINEQHLQNQQQLQLQQQQQDAAGGGLRSNRPPPVPQMSHEEMVKAGEATREFLARPETRLSMMSPELKAMAVQLSNDARWGAYALSPQQRKAGFSNGPTEQAAVQNAMTQCGREDCRIVAAVTNVCYAAVYGEQKGGAHFDYLAQGATPALARQTALTVCSRNANRCVAHKEGCAGDALLADFIDKAIHVK